MLQLKSLIETKCSRGMTVEENCPIYLAYQKMVTDHSPCLVVVSDNEVLGIIQNEDYVELLSHEDRISLISPVHQLMNKHFYFASPNYELEEAIHLMQKHKLQILPIIEEEKFLGVFTYATLLDCLANQHSDTIRNLFTYITGFDNFEPEKEIHELRDLIKY